MKLNRRLKQAIVLFLCVISSQVLSATHLIGGEVSHEYIGNHNYIVELKVYRDCSGIQIQSNYMILYIRELNNTGSFFQQNLPYINSSDVTGVCSSEPTICSGNASAIYGIEEYIYRDTVNVPFDNDINAGGVIFDWGICCYPNSLTTINASSSNTDIYAYSIAYYQNNIYYNDGPKFNDKPINYACLGETINYGNGAVDMDNDSLVFSLQDCIEFLWVGASNLQYNYLDYNPGFSGTQPFSSQNPITIDSTTGMIQFTPTAAEIGPLCVMVEEYRNGVKISEKIRSVLLNIQNCSNANPSISGVNGTASISGVTGTTTITNFNVGQQVCFDIQAYDDMGQNVTFSHSNNLTGATYTTTNLGNNPTLTVCWTPTINDMGVSIFSVTAEDDNCPTLGKSIQTYKFSVNKLFTIEGHVFQPDGSFLSNAEVQLYDTTGVLVGLENTINGFYRFVFANNSYLNQSYYVAATPDTAFNSLGKTYYGDVPVPQYSTAIPIYTNKTNIANINVLEEVITTGNGQISGIVKSTSTGNIVPDTRIVVVNSNGDYIKEAIADQNGVVEINDLSNVTYPIWVDDFNINNDIAPPVDIALTPIHDNIEFLLHDTYLELSYPTNTGTIGLGEQIQINPNPTNGLLNVTFPTTVIQIEIIDVNGKLLKQKAVQSQVNETLDLSDLPNQVYFIRLMTAHNIVIKRIVKQ